MQKNLDQTKQFLISTRSGQELEEAENQLSIKFNQLLKSRLKNLLTTIEEANLIDLEIKAYNIVKELYRDSD